MGEVAGWVHHPMNSGCNHPQRTWLPHPVYGSCGEGHWKCPGHSASSVENRMAEAAALVVQLYALEEMGGPLHVQLDDGNLDIDMTPMYSDRHSLKVHEICDRIAELMTPMNLEQRKTVVRRAGI